MADKNGVCKRKDIVIRGHTISQRQHTMVEKVDGQGRTYTACAKCGNIEVIQPVYSIPKK